MNGDILLGLFLRFLPTILIAALGFIAATDKKSREQWTNLLYQIGSIKPAQREDAKIQSGVRWPFLLVAFIFLIWPLRYYQHSTKVIEVKENPFSKPVTSTSPAFQNSVTDNSVTDNSATNSTTVNGAAANNATPETTTNSTGTATPQSPMFR